MFNFYLPDHSPAGQLADAGLVAPELQITTSSTITGMTNLVDFTINGDFVTDVPDPPFSTVRLNFDDYLDLADDVDALLDRLDLVFTQGRMQATTRAAIRRLVQDIADLPFRTKTAIYLVLVSPDYAIQS